MLLLGNTARDLKIWNHRDSSRGLRLPQSLRKLLANDPHSGATDPLHRSDPRPALHSSDLRLPRRKDEAEVLGVDS